MNQPNPHHSFTKKYSKQNNRPSRQVFTTTKQTNQNDSSRRKKPKKHSHFWRYVAYFSLFTFFVGVLTVLGVFMYFAKDLPDPDQIHTRQVAESTKIYDRTGEHLLYEIHGEEKRTVIGFEEMPEYIKLATITLEDRDFFSHHGIKLTSITRALLNDLFGTGLQQGGSTITQQFVKNSLLTREKTYVRKIKEVILSFELERKFSKQEILAMYLNEIPYGSNAYGIEAAAQTFFGKSALDLTLAESALLASLPQAPSYYSPFGGNTEKLKVRQEYVLDQMASIGYFSEEEVRIAKEVDVLSKIEPNIENIYAPHFVMYVKEYLEEKYGREAVENGGLTIHTTLDWNLQNVAQTVVRNGAFANAKKWNAENAALTAVDPQTGQILAMVGSRDFFDTEIDGQVNVTIRDRQPGSSIKPFVYLTAFMRGFTPETILYDVPTEFNTGSAQKYSPNNYDGQFRGPIEMRYALPQSLNIPAVKTLYLVGIQNAIDTTKSLGITTLNDTDRYGLSLVLGGGEVKLIDHTRAYATLGAGGIRHEMTALLRVIDADRNLLEEYIPDSGVRVVDEKYVAMLSNILSTNEYRAPVFGENNPFKFDGLPIAAKTGTTNEFRDGWAMGYSPTIAAGVWVGNNDNTPMRPGADGSVVAAPIWRAFMDEAIKNVNLGKFPKYEPAEDIEKDVLNGIVRIEEDVKVCEIPGEDDKYCLSNDYCPEDKEKKKDFADVHSILYWVNKDNPQGDELEHPEEDPQYEEWERGVKEYYKDQGKFVYGPIPEKECREDDFKKYRPEIKLDISDNFTERKVKLEADVDAPYDVEWVRYYINGEEVGKTTKKPYAKTWTVPEALNDTRVTVKVVVRDKNGNENEDEESVDIDIPTTP